MEKLDKMLNEDCTTKKTLFKNHFWLGTISIVVLCIFLYLKYGNDWNFITPHLEEVSWSEKIDISNILYSFFNNFEHGDLEHVLLNMLCFFVVGLYLERKIGTVKLLCLVFFFAVLCASTVSTITMSVYGHGYSCVNYALYTYVIIDFIFMLFKKDKRTASKILSGLIIIGLIYFATCYNSEPLTSFPFTYYPHDLLHNMGHVGGTIAGLCVGLLFNIMSLGYKNQTQSYY